jgi:hypothetical protein
MPEKLRNVPANDVPLDCAGLHRRDQDHGGQVAVLLLIVAVVALLLLPAFIMMLAQLFAGLE